ncbi:hypothetical protein [Streptomyces sp. NPDC053431]|uniref:hypothetical protein n=1 Tax=Streptomyces sp. NPDC053431 TaxID=3365703 RepID=UPI0037D5839F
MNESAGGPGRLATFVGAIAAPTSLVTALLYYFGYYHAYWFFAYFRVNSTVLGFSTADYLMRSLDVLWVPLTVIATLAVIGFWGYDLARRRLAAVMGPAARRRTTAAVACVGFLLTLGGLWSTFTVTFLSHVLTLAPSSLSAGVCLLAYARHLARRNATDASASPPPPAPVQGPEPEPACAPRPAPADPSPVPEEPTSAPSEGDAAEDPPGAASPPAPSAPEPAASEPAAPAPVAAAQPAAAAEAQPPAPPSARPEWALLAEWGVVFTLVMLGIVWAANDYAASVGTVRAERYVAGLSHYPSTVVYSERSLALSGPGVTETRCAHEKGEEAAYGYRYDGLTLILQSGNQYVLVPNRWTPADGVALVLPRNDSVRLEFGPPPDAARAASPAPSC